MKSRVLQLLTKITHGSAAKRPPVGFQTLQQIRENSFGTVENLPHRNGKITGVATGFVELDRMTSGLQKGELTIIAAVPCMGSTAFAMNIAVNAAINQNAIVGIFSLGINKLSLLKRTLSSQARVHIRRLVTGFLSQDDLDKVEIAMEVLNATRISIDDTASITLAELRARATQLRKDQNGLDLIIVDALHLMSSTTLSTGHGADENRTQDLSAISCGLRALAKELNVPVIAVLPLPIMSRPNGDWRPILNDLRVYGSIERDADVVIFIHREECFQCDEEMSETGSSKVEAILAKYHNGPTCTFYLNFIPGYIRFRDLEQTADALREA